jgi:uncharacterized protein YegL
MRRLPVYLLLDCSESMIGEGLRAMQQSVEVMLRSLRTDPHALETVWLSCITFARDARLEFPLTELTDVQTPKLKVRPGTAIGAALNLCADRIQAEVRKTSVVQKGDWRPLIILITDGQSTDNWSMALSRLGQHIKPRPANIYAIGVGEDVDTNELRQLTDIVLHLPDMTEDRIKKLFVWLTASVTENSRGVHEQEGTGGGVNLSKLPKEIVKIDKDVPPREGPARQVMLFARCSRGRQPYLLRYHFDDYDGAYHAVSAHTMDVENPNARESFSLPPISSEMLIGSSPCPYCSAASFASCGNCGTVFCYEASHGDKVICPGCQRPLTMRASAEGESFDIKQSLT